MTILSTPASNVQTASTSQELREQLPLQEQRRRLQETQSQITHIHRIQSQLQQLLPNKGSSNGRRLSTSSETSSWSVGTSSSRGSVASDIRGSELLVNLSGVAFAPATISKVKTASLKLEDHGNTSNVFVRSASTSTEELGLDNLVLLDNAKKDGNFKEMPIEQAIDYLDERRQTLEVNLSKLRDEVVSTARATMMEHLGGQAETSIPSDDLMASVNEQGQALNEEGLPFVDPVEPIAEEQERNATSALTPFVREAMSKEARQHWMESILNKLEDEEESQPVDESDIPGEIASQPRPQRPQAHRRLSSADRPAPTRSVLKHTGPIPPPLPKFGAAGIRRGFLNLNPSSPAAEQSSDPVESFDFSSMDKDGLVRSNSSLEEGGSSNLNSMDERMSRSMELPKKKDSEQKRKKTVRILSPEGKREPRQSEATVSKDSNSTKPASSAEDEHVQDEARSILELLGLDAIKDHPQAAGLYEALKDSEKMEQLAKKAEAARQVALEKEVDKPRKPAVGQTVTERPSIKAKADLPPAGRGISAFKKGFLNDASVSSSAVSPEGPRLSQGIPALERATQSDQGLEKEREKNGLKPAVPHARPSKAFAEKLEARRKGERAVPSEGEVVEDSPARMSKVRFGDLGNEEAEAQSSASFGTDGGEEEKGDEKESEEGDDDDSIEMQIREEHLDEDTVDALGYFSDEEYDPDIGLNEEEIMLSRPQFTADASAISNEELRREYERMKAALGASDGGANDDDDGEDGFAEGRDLSLHDGNEEATTVSRFKRDRIKRALTGQTVVSNELGTGLEEARNIGPSMLIPSIANVRFPVNGQEVAEGREVQLGGKSDEEEDELEDLMRQRLVQRQEAAAMTPTVKKAGHPDAPPQVLSTKDVTESTKEEETAQRIKKPSLFKSRMNQK